MQEYRKFLIDTDKSEHSQRNTMRFVLFFSDFLQSRNNTFTSSFLQVKDRETILESWIQRRKARKKTKIYNQCWIEVKQLISYTEEDNGPIQ